MRSAPWRFPQRRRRAGLTVVEVLAALVIVNVGLLGMAGTSVLAVRTAAAAARERRALARLELRLASLHAGGCGSAASGIASAAADDLHERWTVAPESRGAALVDITVDWREGAGRRVTGARSAIIC